MAQISNAGGQAIALSCDVSDQKSVTAAFKAVRKQFSALDVLINSAGIAHPFHPIAEVTTKAFRVWIIPHTYEVTALRERKPGSLVNLEADMLAKYARNLLTRRVETFGPPL